MSERRQAGSPRHSTEGSLTAADTADAECCKGRQQGRTGVGTRESSLGLAATRQE